MLLTDFHQAQAITVGALQFQQDRVEAAMDQAVGVGCS